MAPVDDVVIGPASPADPAALAVLRAYMREVASRWYARPVSDDEIEGYLLDDPSDDLAPPSGLFLLARRDDRGVGCVGLRLLPGRIGEVKRMYVVHTERGRGLGRRLLADLERHAVERGAGVLRLDTRTDLVEARALYAAMGYREVPAFNAGPFAQVWMAKDLDEVAGGQAPGPRA